MKTQTLVLGLVSALLLAGGAAASTTTYVVVDNGLGLSSGYACLSSTGSGSCSADQMFAVGGATAVTGSLTYNDVANTIDVDITLTTASMYGSHDGVAVILFSDLNYSATGIAVLNFGGQIFGIANTYGTVSGIYEQSNGTVTVAGPDDIAPLSTLFSGLSCSSLNGGLCGLTVGASRAFKLNVGATGDGDLFDFVHTFSFNVDLDPGPHMPEPSAAMVYGIGLLIVGRRMRATHAPKPSVE